MDTDTRIQDIQTHAKWQALKRSISDVDAAQVRAWIKALREAEA